MTYAIFFALVSLAAAGCLDVTFRCFSLKERSRGMYVFGCGFVWLVLQLAYLTVTDTQIRLDEVTILYGLLTGAFLVLANILLIESLTGLDVSLGSMIYRLNTIGVVAISFVLLAEDVGVFKLLGIGIGVAAVLILYRRSDGGDTVPIPFLFFVMAVAASAFRAIYGVVSKVALEQGAAAEGLLVIAAISWIVGGVAYAAFREKRVRITGKKAAYAVVSGTLAFAVVNALIEALKNGEASVVVPIANLSFAVAMLLSLFLGMEQLSSRKYIAIGCAALSVFLMAQTT
ncbi:DMT family transporter [Alphaproteobacteria bacterium]|nr:DMT family transporter [Alphaproteobacteria bacterium]